MYETMETKIKTYLVITKILLFSVFSVCLCFYESFLIVMLPEYFEMFG